MKKLNIKIFIIAAMTIAAFSGMTLFALGGQLDFERDSSLPLVHVIVVFKGGASTDPEHKNGVTDIMGKLMLRGTKSKTKSQIDLMLDQLGANLAVDNHAEYIAFHGNVLSENTKPFMELMAEILTSPSFRAGDLEKLKREQISQLGDEVGQDRSLVRLRFDQVFFKGHPYSKSNQGRIADIKSLQVADLQAQYQKLIRDSQMLVLASGDTQSSAFDPVMNAIHQTRNSGSTPLPPIPEFKNYPKKLRVVIFDKPDRTQTQVQIGQKGVAIQSPDMDALTLGNFAFGGGSFQSRLMVELRVKRGWTYGAGSGLKLAAQPHSWKIGFFPKNADTPPAIVETLKMVRQLREKGITQAEFDFSKQSLINGSGFTYNTPAKRMENTLIEKLYGLPEGYHKQSATRIAALTLEQVNQSLRNFLTPDQMMVGLVATAAASKADIAKALGISEDAIEVQDYLKE